MNDINNKTIKKVTIVGSITNVFLAIIKVVFGLLFKSQSLIADGIHSWSDLVTDFAVIFGVHFWNKEPDSDHPYGHGRIETFVTLLIGFFLFFVALLMSYNAVVGIVNYTAVSASWLTLVIAVFSIVSKEIMYRYNIKVGNAINSRALIANAWHHRSDAFSSIPVALAVIVAKLFPYVKYTDQIATILVSVFLAKAAFSIVSGCIDELMEKNEALDLGSVLDVQKKLYPKIHDYHKIHVRRLGSQRYVDLHMLVNRDMSVHDSHILSGKVKQALIESKYQIRGVIIHIEPYDHV
jgi:cation diffusion facilitator family transporter